MGDQAGAAASIMMGLWDTINTRQSLLPRQRVVRGPVRQQVYGPVGLDVDQDRAVESTATEREVIAQHPHRPGPRGGQGHQQPQHAGPPGRHPQRGGQPGPGPPGQRRRDRPQRGIQRRGPARVPRGQPFNLLGEAFAEFEFVWLTGAAGDATLKSQLAS